VSVRALVGLAALNLLALAPGVGLLYALRGWRTWREVARLLGLAYLLGMGGLGVALVLELVADVPFGGWTIVVTAVVLTTVGAAVGRWLGRPLPAIPRGPSGWLVSPAAVLPAALVVVYMEAAFRMSRLQGLYAFDAWAFWVPKAKAIYFFGGLDEQFFRLLTSPTYPPLVPALEAAAFHFMGAVDVVTLHVQFWFFFAGFVAAVAGLLSSRVPPLLLWPFLLLVLVAPRVADQRLVAPQADFLLAYFFSSAALLVALWLLEREGWQLAAATVLLGAAMLTKREGFLLAAGVFAAAVVASWRERRAAWPRLAAMVCSAFALSLPWRVWFTSRGLGGEAPAEFFDFSQGDRAWRSIQLAVGTFFDYGLWLIVGPLALTAIALAFAAGARRLPLYAALLYSFALLGFAWAVWAFRELPLIEEDPNPIVRLTASLIMLSAALVPLLLEAAWRGRRLEGGAG